MLSGQCSIGASMKINSFEPRLKSVAGLDGSEIPVLMVMALQ